MGAESSDLSADSLMAVGSSLAADARSVRRHMSTLAELGRWYAAHCNGEWEHSYGVVVDSMDNPGWWVKIDLVGTELADRSFQPLERGEIDQNHSGPDWIRCKVANGQFHGVGDPTKLTEILQTCLAWARS